MSVAIDPQMSWPPHSMYTQSRYQYGGPQMLHEPPIPPRNEMDLTREQLIDVLTHMSNLLDREFQQVQVRLVVHGGACMLLHPGLHELSQQQSYSMPGDNRPRRKTTRDVDYIHRSFASEYRDVGFPDATERLQRCIRATARHFRLGADWMNSDADVALPMAVDPATSLQYDPIYKASVQANNIHLHTIFTSPNKALTLISVTPFWAVALKLVRYTKWDPGDICLILENGTRTSKTRWTAQTLETWIVTHCWPMNYSSYDVQRKRDMLSRIAHAVQMVSGGASDDRGSNSRVTSAENWMTSSHSGMNSSSAGGWSANPTAGSFGFGEAPVIPRGGMGAPRHHNPRAAYRPDDMYANGAADDFHGPVGAFLDTSSVQPVHQHHYPSTNLSSKKLSRKSQKRERDRGRSKDRRFKLLGMGGLGWRGPDDSDSDDTDSGVEDSSQNHLLMPPHPSNHRAWAPSNSRDQFYNSPAGSSSQVQNMQNSSNHWSPRDGFSTPNVYMAPEAPRMHSRQPSPYSHQEPLHHRHSSNSLGLFI